MATEVTEFPAQDVQFGIPVGVPALPLRNTPVGAGVLTLGVDCQLIRILPAADIRVRFAPGNGGQADPGAPDTSCMLLKANVSRDFAARAGTKMIFA